MDKPLLGLAAGLAWAVCAALLGCDPLGHDPLELDPALRDSSLTALSPSEGHAVPRCHLLESFGSFGCVSCPEAETRLLPYIHPDLGNRAYSPRLIIVNYHVKFGTVADPWVTPAIQALNDARGYVSLPQAVMDGSNAAFGIREKDVAFQAGEYDSLAARAGRADSSSRLELRLDTAGIVYDTSAGRIRFHFRARNLGSTALGPLDFRVMAVKNKPAVIPIYPTLWEVIVRETTDLDADGRKLSLTGLPALTAKAYSVNLAVSTEDGKHVRPPPLGPETLPDYALIILAEDANGVILNVSAFKYGPIRTPGG